MEMLVKHTETYIKTHTQNIHLQGFCFLITQRRGFCVPLSPPADMPVHVGRVIINRAH